MRRVCFRCVGDVRYGYQDVGCKVFMGNELLDLTVVVQASH